ncbi:MAG: TonB-dependent receptor [Rubrivivax sp.]|nr:TonB-dependent receptor [Rubrivivax sp.]
MVSLHRHCSARSRPGFAVSTTRFIGGAATALLAITAVCAPAAHAQGAAAGDPVVITGTRTPQRVDRALAEVTVIERAQIEAAAGRTLAELLATESGVQFWSNGGLGKTASVSLRGLESRHTLLLIDGVRYGSATVGSPTWDNIPLDAIERIEVVRGPMSGLYGSEAVGGVIQVFTRGGQPGFRPEGGATAGSRSYGELAAGARFGTGAFDGHLRLQHRRTDGISTTNERVPFGSFNADDDGFEQTSLSGRLGLRLGTWRAEATMLSAKGTNHYDDGPGADSRTRLRTEVLSAQVSGPAATGWRTALKWARSIDELDTLASASPFTDLGTIGSTQQQVSWENGFDTPLGTALALAERIEQEVERPGTPFAVSERTITGLGLGLNGEAGAHGWQASVRRDRNSQFGNQTTGSLAYGLEVAPGLRATASFGTSFTAPSFNQLYFPGFGNPLLQPEEGLHREVGLRWSQGVHEVRFAAFSSDIRGYITPGANPTNVNADIEGLTLTVRTQLQGWRLSAGGELIDPRNSNPNNANFGRQLPRRAREVLRLGAERRIGAWTLGASMLNSGARFENAANSVELPGYTVWDLRADWAPAPGWALGLKVNNVADRRYETALGYNQPAREAFVTLRWAPR